MMVPDTGDVVSTSKLIRRAARNFLGDGALPLPDWLGAADFSSVRLPLRFRPPGLLGAGERDGVGVPEPEPGPEPERAGLAPPGCCVLLAAPRVSVSKAVKVRGEGWFTRSLGAPFLDKSTCSVVVPVVDMEVVVTLFGVHGADLMEGDASDDDDNGDNDDSLVEEAEQEDVRARGRELATMEVVQELVMVWALSRSHALSLGGATDTGPGLTENPESGDP